MVTAMGVKETVKNLRENFNTRETIDLSFRINQLNNLKQMLVENKDELTESVRKDYKKPIFEIIYEIDYSISNIDYTLKNLKNWVSPANLPKNIFNILNTLEVCCEPLGVVLIITPWNFPILLPVIALVGAIAAGNCVLIKPSEISPTISNLLGKLIHEYLDNRYYCVICGGVNVATDILKEKFDHILYVGSTHVAKIIMEAAAKYLTPVTLELGGKCPCYIDKQCDIVLAAKKVAYAKTINAGQICLSVDYVLCHKDIYHDFVELIKSNWIEFYGEDPYLSHDYGRIVNKFHFKKIINMLEQSKGNVIAGAQNNEEDCYIAPTLLVDIDNDDPIMQQEIFGPILPIIVVDTCENAIDIINSIPKPLVVYTMTSSSDVITQIRYGTSSGSLVINDAIMQTSLKDLPSGGVGDSGTGRFFGKETFKLFSNQKSFYHKKYYTQQIENVALPPMTERKYGFIKWNI